MPRRPWEAMSQPIPHRISRTFGCSTSAGSFPVGFQTPAPLYGCVSSQASENLHRCRRSGAGRAPPFLMSEALPARRRCSRNAKAVEGHPAAMQFKCALADDRKSRLEFEASLHSNGTGVYEREGSPRFAPSPELCDAAHPWNRMFQTDPVESAWADRFSV